jgi:hypothetical protein
MSFRHSNTSQGSDDFHGLKESNTETDCNMKLFNL